MVKQRKLNLRVVVLFAVIAAFILAAVIMSSVTKKSVSDYKKDYEQAISGGSKNYDKAVKALIGWSRLVKDKDSEPQKKIVDLLEERIEKKEYSSPEMLRRYYGLKNAYLQKLIRGKSGKDYAVGKLEEQYWLAASSTSDEAYYDKYINFVKDHIDSSAFSKKKKKAEVYFRLAKLYVTLASRMQAGDDRYLDEASESISKAIEFEPENLDYRRFYIQFLVGSKKLDECIKELDNIYKTVKTADAAHLCFDYYWQIGLQIKKYSYLKQEAAAIVRSAREDYPDNILPILDKVTIEYYMMKSGSKNVEDAKEYLGKIGALLAQAKKVSPNNYLVYEGYAKLYSFLGKPTERKNAFDKAVECIARDKSLKSQDKNSLKAYFYYKKAEIIFAQWNNAILEKKTKLAEDLAKSLKELDQKLSSLSSGQPRQLIVAGYYQYTLRKYSKALAKFDQAYEHKNYVAEGIPVTAHLRASENARQPTRGIKILTELLAMNSPKKRNLSPADTHKFYRWLIGYHTNQGEYKTAKDYTKKLYDVLKSYDLETKDVEKQLALLDARIAGSTAGQDLKDKRVQSAIIHRAQSLISQNKYSDAISELQAILKADPRCIRATELLYLTYIQLERFDLAILVLERAEKLHPDNKRIPEMISIIKAKDPEDRYNLEKTYITKNIKDKFLFNIRMAQLSARYGKPKEADKYMIAAEKVHPDSFAVLRYKISKAVKKEDWDKARELANRIKDEYARCIFLANVYLAAEKRTLAIKELEKALEIRPNDPEPNFYLGKIHFNEYDPNPKKEDMKKAERYFKACLDADSSAIGVRVQLAKIAQACGDRQKFKNIIQEAYELETGRANPYIIEAYNSVFLDQQNPALAIQKRTEIFKRNPKNVENLYNLIWLLGDNGQPAEALEKAEAYYKYAPNKLLGLQLRAEYLRQLGKFSDASSMYQEAIKSAKNKKAKQYLLLTYAEHLANDPRNIKLAEAKINQAIKIDPKFAAAHYQLATIYRLAGLIARQKGNNKLYLQNYQKAIQAVDKTLELEPNDLGVKLKRCEFLAEAGQQRKARTGYEDVLRQHPKSIDAHMGLANQYYLNDQLEGAEREYKAVLKIKSDYVPGIEGLSNVYAAKGELNAAVKELEKALSFAVLKRNKIVLTIALAKLYKNWGLNAKALNEYSKLISLEPHNQAFYASVISLHIADDEFSIAQKLLSNAYKKFPDNKITYKMLEAKLWKASKEPQREIEALAAANKLRPSDQSILIQYIDALILNKQYARAKQVVVDNADIEGLKPYFDAVKASELFKQGQGNKAFELYTQALASTKNTFQFSKIFRMMTQTSGDQKMLAKADSLISKFKGRWIVYSMVGDLYRKNKKYAKADQCYKKMLGMKIPKKAQFTAYKMLSDVSASTGNDSLSAKYLQKALELAPNHPGILNDLAYYYVNIDNNPKQALRYVKKAMRLLPGNPSLIDTYAWVIAKSGDYKQAEALLVQLTEVGRKIKSPAQLYHLGYVYEMQGDKRKAKGFYKQALAYIKDGRDEKLRKDVQEGLKRTEDR